MGLADYGVNGSQSYSYDTLGLLSETTIVTLLVNPLPHGGSIYLALNAVACLSAGCASQAYQVRNIVKITQTYTGSLGVTPIAEVRNYSAIGATMGSLGLATNASSIANCSSSGTNASFYYCVGSQTTSVTQPFAIALYTLTGTMNQGPFQGDSFLAFSYATCEGQTQSCQTNPPYDFVFFTHQKSSGTDFVIGGTNPAGHYNVAENVLTSTGSIPIAIQKLYVQMSMFYIPTSLRPVSPPSCSNFCVPHAWSGGADIEGGITNLAVTSQIRGSAFLQIGTESDNQVW